MADDVAPGPGADTSRSRPVSKPSAGAYLGVDYLGGQPYHHYRAEQGTWVSAALEQRGFAAVYAKETGYGAYRGIVRSSTGEPVSNPDWIKPGQEFYVPVLTTSPVQRPDLAAERATAPGESGPSRTEGVPPGNRAPGGPPAPPVDATNRGLASSPVGERASSAGTEQLTEALRDFDRRQGFGALPRPIPEVSAPAKPPAARGGPPAPPVSDRERRVANLADVLLGMNQLTAFDLLPPPVQRAVERGEAAWPDGTPIRPDDMGRLEEQARRKLKPLYRDLLRPGERLPSIEEQAQLGGLIRAFLLLLATDPTVADRIVRDTLAFRYPDDQIARAEALEYFWMMIFDPLLWLGLNPAALAGAAPEGLQLARQFSQLAGGAGTWSVEANKLLGEASVLARAGRTPEALNLARQAQELAVSEADRLTAARSVGGTGVAAEPVAVVPSAAGDVTTVQEARLVADRLRLNPQHNAVDTPAFTLNGEAYWGPFYRASRGIPEVVETGELGGRGPSVGRAYPRNPSALAYLRNRPEIEQLLSAPPNGEGLSFYTKVRPQRFYGNGAMWPLHEETFGLTGDLGAIRDGMRAGVIDGQDAAFVPVFFAQPY
jgi:hypothetical protein